MLIRQQQISGKCICDLLDLKKNSKIKSMGALNLVSIISHILGGFDHLNRALQSHYEHVKILYDASALHTKFTATK